MSTLVIAEHDNATIKVATLNAVAAAQALGGDVDILVAGSSCDAAAQAAAQVPGVGKVLCADNAAYANQLAENVSLLIADVAASYDNIVAPATTNGKNTMPRVAALMNVAQVSDIISVESADTFKRPIYAGNVIATVQSTDPKKVITVRTTAFDPVAAEGGSASVEAVGAVHDAGLSTFELTAASVVISGGRGMQNGDNFQLLEGIADKLGAAIGASRAAVDAGFVPNDYQVGQTGKIVAPDLYIAVGISGAIQHLAGMKDSKIIVAINKDEDAPIFQVADYGLVADLFTALPEFEAAI
jgi:electron transfer flavoprotein alpha subunit